MNGSELAPTNDLEHHHVRRGSPHVSCRCHDRTTRTSDDLGGRPITVCSRCGLFWLASAEGQNERIQYYRDAYWNDFHNEQAGSARENIFAHALDRIESHVGSTGFMVDVGCGPGAFLAMSQARGWKARGYDPSRSAVAEACAKGLNAVEGVWPPSPLQDEQVDVVTMVNVLDHLPNPIEALEEVWRVLKVGGLVYLRVPNGTMHVRLAKILTVLGLGHLPVIHVYGFSAKSFRHYLPQLGFHIEEIRTAPPSQQDPYVNLRQRATVARAILKRTDRLVYAFMSGLGFDSVAYGLSLEVLARKHG